MFTLGFLVLLTVTLRGAAAADTACGPPPQEPDLELQGNSGEESYPSGTIVAFTCRPGFYRLGLIRKACLDGQWKSISDGSCMDVGTCHRPPRYLERELQGEWNEDSYPSGTVATFSCRPGYTQHDAITEKCVSGEWQPVSRGNCQKKSCGHPGDIQFGTFKLWGDDFVFGAEVQYTCNEGHTMASAHDNRYCAADGWTNELPKCLAMLWCGPPPRQPELQIQGDWDEEAYPPGEVATFTCLPGYTSLGDIKKVCIEGQWEANGSCKKKHCGRPGEIPFGAYKLTVGDDFEFGAEVEYTCNKGYKTEGQHNMIKCVEDGWTKPLPECKENKDPCESPPTVKFGEVLESLKERYRIGESVVYECPIYYKMEGSSTVTCLGGDWSEPPVCLAPCTVTVNAMRERNIELKLEGAVKTFFRHQDRIEFTCCQGYEISDHELLQVTCNGGGFQYPKCTKVGSCILSQPMMESRNIYLNRNSEILHEETVRFECKEGTVPENTLEGKCNMRNLNYPRCVIPKSCIISVEDFKNQNVELETPGDLGKLYKHGADVRMKCKVGFGSASKAIPPRGQCYDGKMKYDSCFPEQIVLLNHDTLKQKALEGQPLHDYHVYYGAGENAQFVCKQVFNDISG